MTDVKITQPMTGEQAIKIDTDRGIKMHEFLMSGGVQQGYKNGIMQYGPPIIVAETPECPFHHGECEAWDQIVAGNGHWTKMEQELAGMKTLVENGVSNKVIEAEIEDLTKKLAERPRDFKQLRDRTKEEVAAETAAWHAAHPPRVYAAAPNKGKAGNPWDRKNMSATEKKQWDQGQAKVDALTGGRTTFNKNHPDPSKLKPAEEVVSETVLASLGETAETIEIEGAEDD